MLKLAVPTVVAAMFALIIPMLLVALMIAVATIVKTIVIKPRLCRMAVILGHLLRGYQRNNL